MNVLLVSANREHAPYPVFPLGLSYLAGPLQAAGHRLSVLDLCFAADPEEATLQALAESNPDVVVLSVRNIDNVTYPGSRSYLSGVRDVVAICRERAAVVVGGSGFSLMPREVLAFLGADYGVVGEGDDVLPRLLARIAVDEGGDGLPGVISRDNAAFLPSQPVRAIGTPLRELFQVERYHREGGMANIQTKRGCPFSCIYCTYPLLEGERMRLRPVADIIAEIRELVDGHGVNYLYFVDDIFNYPQEFALELCRAMLAARLPVAWSAFINPDFLPPQLLDAMLAAGCDALEFGTDSGSPVMLGNLRKSFGIEKVREASRLCREAGVDFAHYILLGGPGETPATIAESFALMDEVAPTAVIAMTGIRIFPGTEIYRQALADGLVTPETDLLTPTFYIAPAIAGTLCELVREEALKRTNWVVPGLEITANDAMLEALRHFAGPGPLWKMLKLLGRRRGSVPSPLSHSPS
ncbi:cobalamin-dependent protein [Geobacter hydrogenophilus]|uniref:B12-binding domain-containing radical SAM protein n=1 Tax=Geobacter hydrogenophilus TaxID=40983 RepID=A0A9W6G2E4_9BACT|nr:lipid biosynthesis B12-binding/radical SAM protein [Geobacter hydrogenophilus]MBT0893007.1 cobalamin-dependent protein [Geobacter hydrogenophilus]GLI39157.1 B12-binding domain-containing radical SAM protein [Geobacter hydrogenophilus]